MDLKILIAFVPLICWALGDFFIQKTSRKIGVIESLFFIGIFATVFLLPFTHQKLFTISYTDYFGLFTLSILIFIYAIILFQSFKVGKLSVVESVVALEMPLTVGVSYMVLGERLSIAQFSLFLFICFGIFLATYKKSIEKHIVFEKGFLLALSSSAVSAFVNFYIGYSAQKIDPLVTIYVTHTFISIFCLMILFYTKQIATTFKNLKTYPKLIFLQSFFDNAGWLGYVYAVLVLPISLTIIISEAYIVLAAMLGYYVNKEVLTKRQIFGCCIALCSVIILTIVTEI